MSRGIVEFGYVFSLCVLGAICSVCTLYFSNWFFEFITTGPPRYVGEGRLLYMSLQFIICMLLPYLLIMLSICGFGWALYREWVDRHAEIPVAIDQPHWVALRVLCCTGAGVFLAITLILWFCVQQLHLLLFLFPITLIFITVCPYLWLIHRLVRTVRKRISGAQELRERQVGSVV